MTLNRERHQVASFSPVQSTNQPLRELTVLLSNCYEMGGQTITDLEAPRCIDNGPCAYGQLATLREWREVVSLAILLACRGSRGRERLGRFRTRALTSE